MPFPIAYRSSFSFDFGDIVTAFKIVKNVQALINELKTKCMNYL